MSKPKLQNQKTKLNEMSKIVFLSIGSNIGDRFSNLQTSIKKLNETQLIKVVEASSVYETLPYGNPKQNNFYNAALKISTDLLPKQLCSELKKIEQEMGRQPAEKWGPRIIDLDIIFYEDLVYDDERLHIPHLESAKRDFVIVPILEIEPSCYHPREKVFLKDIIFDENEKTIIRILPEKLL